MKESLKIGHFTYLIHLDVTLSLTDAPFSKRDYKNDFLFLMTVGFFNTTLFSDYKKGGQSSGEERVLFQQCYSGETTLMNNLNLCVQ